MFTCYFALNHLYHFDLPSRFVPPREFCPSFRVLGLTTFRNWIPFKHVSELAGLYPCQRQLFSTYKSINHPTKAKLPKSLTLHKGTHTYIYIIYVFLCHPHFLHPWLVSFLGFPTGHRQRFVCAIRRQWRGACDAAGPPRIFIGNQGDFPMKYPLVI